MNPELAHAVEIARRHIPIQKRVVRPECWFGYTIVITPRGDYRVYEDNAWDEQHESLLPWSAPEGTPIGHVDLNGTFTRIGDNMI